MARIHYNSIYDYIKDMTIDYICKLITLEKHGYTKIKEIWIEPKEYILSGTTIVKNKTTKTYKKNKGTYEYITIYTDSRVNQTQMIYIYRKQH